MQVGAHVCSIYLQQHLERLQIEFIFVIAQVFCSESTVQNNKGVKKRWSVCQQDGRGEGKVSEVMCDQRVSARRKGEVGAAIVKRQQSWRLQRWKRWGAEAKFTIKPDAKLKARVWRLTIPPECLVLMDLLVSPRTGHRLNNDCSCSPNCTEKLSSALKKTSLLFLFFMFYLAVPKVAL